MRARRFTSVAGKSNIRFILASAACAACAASVASAASGTWSGAADSAWENPSNWDAVPGSNAGVVGSSADIASFSGMPVTNNVVTVDLNRNIAGLFFDPDPTLSHPDVQGEIPYLKIGAAPNTGNTLYLSNGGVTQTSSVDIIGGDDAVESDINAPMVLNGASYSFINNAGSTVNTLGALRLFGHITPALAGATTITLDGDHGAQASSRSEIYGAISDGPGQIGIVKNGVGTWEVNADSANPNTYSGDTVINGGILRSSGGDPGGVVYDGLGGFSPNSHYIINAGGTLRNSVVGSTVKKITLNFGGQITASGASITTLNIASESGPSLLINFAGSNDPNVTRIRIPINLTGGVANEGGITLTAAPGAAGTGPVDVGDTTSLFSLGNVVRVFEIGEGADANEYDLRVRGPISGDGGIVKTGTGVLRFDNPANSFTGIVEIREGSFIANVANNLTGQPALLVNGGNLHVKGGHTQTFGNVSVTRGSITGANDLSTVAAPAFGFNVAAGESAAIDAILADAPAPATLVKSGDGAVTFTGALTYTGATTVNGGLLSLATSLAHSPSLSVSGGTVELRATSDPNRVIRTGALSVTGSGRIDLKHNKLITASPVGAFAGGAYSGVTGLIVAGRGSAGGNALWNGTTGITTSDSRAIDTSNRTALGIIDASDKFRLEGGAPIAETDTALFAGQTVTGADTLVMFTWGGDANLDGKINIDDYGRIDSNVGTPGANGWANGDFNYDGKINIDDYGIIDSNISNQTGVVFPTGSDLAGVTASAGTQGVSAVPEPASLSLLALGASALLPRRRRGGGTLPA